MEGTRLGFAALLALLLSAAHAEAQTRAIFVCAVVGESARQVEGRVDGAGATTTLKGHPFDSVHPREGPGYATGASWYINNETIQVKSIPFVKYGLPRVLGLDLLELVANYRGVGFYAEKGRTGATEVLYAVTR